ncbi:MAG TPA: hypothetical protein DCX89_08175 [Saprospirales bacterium]|nr:hypothetical protein [Saprospirales bacterium]HRQ30437.1 hypothetical protein [Saprospiraceae bacterium]
MRTFTAIFSLIFLLSACNPDITPKKDCKTEDFDLLEQAWSIQLEPYFQYNRTKWFDTGEFIALVSSHDQLTLINKKTGLISGNASLQITTEDQIHIFDNKFYFDQSSGIVEMDPLTGVTQTIFDPPTGFVENMIAKDHIMVVNVVNNLRTSFELFFVDLNTKLVKPLTAMEVDPDFLQYFSLSLLHNNQSGNWQLYYNIFSASYSKLKVNKTMRIDLLTGEEKTLSEPAGISKVSYVINNKIYSVYPNHQNGTSIKRTDLDLNSTDLKIDPNINTSQYGVFHNYRIRENDIVFYNTKGFIRYDLNTGIRLDQAELPGTYQFPYSDPVFIIGNQLVIPYLYDLLKNDTPVLGIMELEDDTYSGDYCDIPAIFNNQSQFVCNDDLYVINYAKQLQKYVIRK